MVDPKDLRPDDFDDDSDDDSDEELEKLEEGRADLTEMIAALLKLSDQLSETPRGNREYDEILKRFQQRTQRLRDEVATAEQQARVFNNFGSFGSFAPEIAPTLTYSSSPQNAPTKAAPTLTDSFTPEAAADDSDEELKELEERRAELAKMMEALKDQPSEVPENPEYNEILKRLQQDNQRLRDELAAATPTATEEHATHAPVLNSFAPEAAAGPVEYTFEVFDKKTMIDDIENLLSAKDVRIDPGVEKIFKELQTQQKTSKKEGDLNLSKINMEENKFVITNTPSGAKRICIINAEVYAEAQKGLQGKPRSGETPIHKPNKV